MNANHIEAAIVRLFQGLATDEEEELVLRWRAQSPKNEAHYQNWSAVWRLTEYEESADRHTPPPGSVIVRAAKRAKLAEGYGNAQVMMHLRHAAIAASILLVIASGTLGFRWLASRSSPDWTLEIATAADERATLMLRDGTAMRVGPQSTVHMVDDGRAPILWLEGRAFFGVKPDRSRTFTVRTRHGEATALGTRFQVSTDEEELQVLVVEGSVRVSSAGTAIEIGEGVLSRSSESAPPQTTTVEDMEEFLAWMGRSLMFRDTPLYRAASEIERSFGVVVDVVDSTMYELPVTATFTDQRVEEVLWVVCQIVGAICTGEEDRFSIRGGIPVGPERATHPRR